MDISYQLDTMIKVDDVCALPAGSCTALAPGRSDYQEGLPRPDCKTGGRLCIDCGHCVADLVLLGAMHQRSMGPTTVKRLTFISFPSGTGCDSISSRGVPFEAISASPSNRTRSCGCWKAVARYAPNGANRQVIRWVVINDPAKVHRMAEMTIDCMKAMKEKAPALYEEAKLEVFVEAWDGGQDRDFAGSAVHPHGLRAKDERTAPPAAMIAIHQIQLAAPGLDRTCLPALSTPPARATRRWSRCLGCRKASSPMLRA